MRSTTDVNPQEGGFVNAEIPFELAQGSRYSRDRPAVEKDQ